MARRALRPTLQLVKPTRITMFHRDDVADEHCTRIELVTRVSKSWKEVAVESKKQTPYKRESEKIFYSREQCLISKRYLRVLLVVDSLFEKGLECVHHFQSESYPSSAEALSCNQ